ncbi:phytoene/squalene synthase family protein [soil metagenome]
MIGLQDILVANNTATSKLADGLELCRQITRRFGTSFYFATQFFPKETREGFYAIYAFARIPNEIVDDPTCKNHAAAIKQLEEWRQEWRDAMAAGGSDDPVVHAIVHIFKIYQIPDEDGEAFLRSMFMDEEKFEYETYSELEDYMYGSAGVIGLMVTRVVGYSTPDAFPFAIKLGNAFQLTNFLRDICEDYEELGRVYMPQNELTRFGLNNGDISRRVYDDRFIAFMKFQIQRNREVYRDAVNGISMLAWRGRLAVRVSYVLYKAILGEVERANYNVYKGRVRTNLSQKVWLSLKALAGVYE